MYEDIVFLYLCCRRYWSNAQMLMLLVLMLMPLPWCAHYRLSEYVPRIMVVTFDMRQLSGQGQLMTTTLDTDQNEQNCGTKMVFSAWQGESDIQFWLVSFNFHITSRILFIKRPHVCTIMATL